MCGFPIIAHDHPKVYIRVMYIHMYIPCNWGAELNRQIVFCRAFVRAVCTSMGACFPFSFVASTGFPFSLPPPSNLLYPAVLVFSVYNVYVYSCLWWAFAWYWTIAELPAWFRNRVCGWFLFGGICESSVTKMEHGLSTVMQTVLKTFFSAKPMRNFATQGMLVPNGQHRFLMRALPEIVVQDYKAFQDMYNLLGPRSHKPCGLLCQNVTEHLETDGEGLIPIRNAKLHRCKLHSKESLAELVKLLNDNQDKLNATDFKTLEQSCGFRFVPGARLCLETCWLLVLAVGLVYYDWLVVLGP